MADPVATTAPKPTETAADKAQKRFYGHLLMHPGAHKAAARFAKKVVAGDKDAIECLKDLASKASSDESAANALRVISVTIKYEHPNFKKPEGLTMLAGGLPGDLMGAAGKIVSLALAVPKWVLSTGGKTVEWAGGSLQSLSRLI